MRTAGRAPAAAYQAEERIDAAERLVYACRGGDDIHNQEHHGRDQPDRFRRWDETTLCGRHWIAMVGGEGKGKAELNDEIFS